MAQQRELPRRRTFSGPHSRWEPLPLDVVADFAAAVREWAATDAHPHTSRGRGEPDSSDPGDNDTRQEYQMPGDDGTHALLAKLDCRNTRWPTSGVRAAQYAMQVHLECAVGECDAKTAAFGTLIAAGKLVPDTGRTR